MIREIRLVTPDSLQYLVTDLLEKIILYENKAISASYRELPTGKYEVTLDVESRKFYADSIGMQTEVPLNDYIAVGVIGENDEELYMQKHHFSSTEKEIKVIVDKKPVKAGIDPYVILIDKEREDNLMKVEVGF